MLKDNRVRLVLAAIVVAFVAVIGYYFYDNIIVSGNTAPVTTGQPVAPTLALKPRASNTPLTRNTDPRFVSDYQVERVIARPVAQQTLPYTSCTEDRRATATPVGQVAPATPTAAATPAATLAATSAATKAALPTGDPILFEIVGKESEACYQVGEIFINRNNQFGLAVGLSTSISGQIAIDKVNVANSQVGQIVVDISQLTSDSSSRDGQIRRSWLESNKFPLAKFTPKEIIGLPEGAYKEGTTLNFVLKGPLTVREKDVNVTFTVSAALKDGVLTGTAVTDVKMTDWGFEPPAIAGMLKANNEARIILNFVAREPKK